MRTITGIGLIATERQEQIVKHGFSVENDQYYSRKELIQAAKFAMNPDLEYWPSKWNQELAEKIRSKDEIGRLTVAGAFIAAEIDRKLLADSSKLYSRQEVEALISNLLEHSDIVMDAISNENTNWDGQELLNLSEESIEKK